MKDNSMIPATIQQTMIKTRSCFLYLFIYITCSYENNIILLDITRSYNK